MRSGVIIALLVASIAVADDSQSDESDDGCKCVPILECPNNALATHGEKIIIFRMDSGAKNQCTSFSMRECCPSLDVKRPSSPTTPSPGVSETTLRVTSPPENRASSSPSRCGKRNKGGIIFRIDEETNTVAQFAEFPWMVMVFNGTAKDGDTKFIAGGSLIHERVVVTAAHRVMNLNLGTAAVRAGEWDLGNLHEPVEHQDMPIYKIIIHEQFDEDYLFNNIALIVTTTPFKLSRNVGIVCLPKANDIVSSNFCVANGWGKNASGYYQQILKKIELPTVPKSDCEEKVRSWSTAYSKFSLHDSVMCAGGIPNKDTCHGDGGGPLTCPVSTNPLQSQLTGITSWGLACGTSFPAFYTDVAQMRPWIDKQMTKLGFSMDYNY